MLSDVVIKKGGFRLKLKKRFERVGGLALFVHASNMPRHVSFTD